MTSTDQSPAPSPLQLSRVKQAASRLEDWTGLSHSESLELTARAYGATSWNALREQETFVPDEALIQDAWRGHEQLAPRYDGIAQLLQKKLCVSQRQAFLLAGVWQPAALSAVFGRPNRDRRAPSEHGDLQLVEAFGAHPALPPGASLAVVTNFQYISFIAVRPGRLARFMKEADGVPLHPIRHMRGAFVKRWEQAAFYRDEEALASLHNLVGRKGSFEFDDAFLAELAQPTPLALLKASWLRAPQLPAPVLLRRFAGRYPWKSVDYPGLAKSWADHQFWTHEIPGFHLTGIIYNSTVFVRIRSTAGAFRSASTWEVQVGAGGLRRFLPDGRDGRRLPHGYYLVKYGREVRGHGPLEGMTPELAAEVRRLTGLAGADDEEDARSGEEGGQTFFSTEAGLAFAKWCAAFPVRTVRHRVRSGENYLGDWWGRVLARMEFELARKGELG